MIESQAAALVVITLGAAVVNGALGYGFSSITVPIALLFLANRVLNPALVLIEVVLNAYVLWNNRDALPNVWRRVRPIVIGLAPGSCPAFSSACRLAHSSFSACGSRHSAESA